MYLYIYILFSVFLNAMINYQLSKSLIIQLLFLHSFSCVGLDSPLISAAQHVGFWHFKWEVEWKNGSNSESPALILWSITNCPKSLNY